MGQVISVANQKGGVGKTTTAINLSSALSKMGKSVLLIDFDPQGNAGRGLGLDISSLESVVSDWVLGEKAFLDVVHQIADSQLSIIPSNLKLASLDSRFSNGEGSNPFLALSHKLEAVKDQYDYVIIDCPPSLGFLSLNALAASDSAIIPVQCEYFAMEAVAQILSTILKVRESYNPKLKINGFLLTMYDARTTLGTEVATQVRGLFKENTFLTMIPRNISIAEASANGEAVTDFKPTASGSKAYLQLAREIIENG